ncbi:hypothetical protein, partial [Leucobacter sp. M11]|uniref:hypothetical protein n=1 Tax=Leucobacter sp. M11 TaxID=2993565 RepID=UPI002D7E80F7
DTDALRANWREGHRFEPSMDPEERARRLRLWEKAVTRSLDWVDEDVRADEALAAEGHPGARP